MSHLSWCILNVLIMNYETIRSKYWLSNWILSQDINLQAQRFFFFAIFIGFLTPAIDYRSEYNLYLSTFICDRGDPALDTNSHFLKIKCVRDELWSKSPVWSEVTWIGITPTVHVFHWIQQGTHTLGNVQTFVVEETCTKANMEAITTLLLNSSDFTVI